MKTIAEGPVASIAAAANLVAKRFIGFDGNYCGADDKAFGVVEADTDSGYQVPVRHTGVALVTAGGIISAGGPVVSSSVGKALAATTFSVTATIAATASLATGAVAVKSDAENPTVTAGATTTPACHGSVLPQVINGYALDAAGADGDVIRVLLA